MKIIKSEKTHLGFLIFLIWEEFLGLILRKKIAELSEAKIKLNAIETSQYPTPAKDQKNSVLDLDKISKNLCYPIKTLGRKSRRLRSNITK